MTATLKGTGVGWPDPLPDGWTEVDSTTATYTVTFGFAVCNSVAPVRPTVVRATCVNGEVTVPTVTPPRLTNLTYTLDPPAPYDPGTEDYQVIVTATLGDGQNWGTMPPGWVETSPTTAVYVVQLPAGSCTEAIPVAPGINEAVCQGGELHPPTLTPPPTDRRDHLHLRPADRPRRPLPRQPDGDW